MDTVKNGELWKFIAEVYASNAAYEHSQNYSATLTSIQHSIRKSEGEVNYQHQLQKIKKLSELMVGRLIKVKGEIVQIFDNKLEIKIENAIQIQAPTFSVEGISADLSIVAYYEQTFRSQLLSFNIGSEVKLEGKIISLIESKERLTYNNYPFHMPTPTVQLTSIERLSGCFIATACYGSYDAPEVLVLRQFRDDRLLKTISGKMLVSIYYFFSPLLANLIVKSDMLKNFIRKHVLEPVVRQLSH